MIDIKKSKKACITGFSLSFPSIFKNTNSQSRGETVLVGKAEGDSFRPARGSEHSHDCVVKGKTAYRCVFTISARASDEKCLFGTHALSDIQKFAASKRSTLAAWASTHRSSLQGTLHASNLHHLKCFFLIAEQEAASSRFPYVVGVYDCCHISGRIMCV